MYKDAKVTMSREEFERRQADKKERVRLAEEMMEWVSPEKAKEFLHKLVATGTIQFKGEKFPETLLILSHGRFKVGEVSATSISTDGVSSSEEEAEEEGDVEADQATG
jgi:hypothetical protein